MRRMEIIGDPDVIADIAKALGAHIVTRTPMQADAIRELGFDLGEMNERLQKTLEEFQAGTRTRGSVEWWMKRDIRYFYRRAYKEGLRTGGKYEELTKADERELMKARYREYKYLKGFLDDVEAGNGVMAYQQRMRMYADALPGMFWLGFVQANLADSRRIKWIVDIEAEHCETCLPLNGRAWTPRQFLAWYNEYHILPSKGCKCKGNCKCHLEDYYIHKPLDN